MDSARTQALLAAIRQITETYTALTAECAPNTILEVTLIRDLEDALEVELLG